MNKKLLTTYTIIAFIFLYLPITVLIVFSFNKDKISSSWSGFTLDWYYKLFQNTDLLNSLQTSIFIAIFSSLIGSGNITLADFSGLSSRVSVYSSNDDYSGAFMTNPMIPTEFTRVTHGDVNIGRHVIIGSGSIILPNVTLEEGVAIGALSLVKKNCTAFGIYLGSPAKRISERKRDLLELEKAFLKKEI